MAQSVYHSAAGGCDFLGLRKGRTGAMEIVYDDGVARRLVWRVCGAANERQLGDALARAVNQTRVIPALYTELRKRAITIDAVAS